MSISKASGDPAGPESSPGHPSPSDPAMQNSMTEVPFARQGTGFALALGALGVVFGDIGTSPLYALQTVFSIDHNSVKPTHADVFGVTSIPHQSHVNRRRDHRSCVHIQTNTRTLGKHRDLPHM